jgi:ribosomal protein L29
MAKTTKKPEEKFIKLADMTAGELEVKAREVAGQIQKQRLERVVGRVKNTREVFNLRKQLARIKTVISQKNAVKSGSNS